MLIMGTQVSNELKCGAAFLASYRVSRAISRLAQLICASIPLSFSLSFAPATPSPSLQTNNSTPYLTLHSSRLFPHHLSDALRSLPDFRAPRRAA
jgi:hypothetical protein